ncbi:MAG: hydrogenase [Armatimonadota bacterium]|nr:MAG: hydrogenase [Armatimonadota bacterium]
MSAQGVISTNKARCRDCYRCVRVCPVKAIRIRDGQAQVDPERCIVCGSCVRECPQHAKQVRSDLERVRRMVELHPRVAASVAPSWIAAFPEYGGSLFPGVLRSLGFALVAETAAGAEMVARKTAEMLHQEDGTFITSACPAVVKYIEKYEPWAAGRVTPLASPMVAHARHLKRVYGTDLKVVFIGPCPAKKAEAELPECAGAVDAVLTFDELRQWLADSRTALQAKPADFDDLPAGTARLFPLEGGLAQAAAIPAELLRPDFAAVSGWTEVREMLANVREGGAVRLFEALFCGGGCINGACFGDGRDLFQRKNRLLQHEKRAVHRPSEDEILAALRETELGRDVPERPLPSANASEEDLREILARMGKNTPEDELNCGACGYETCRDNARAVLSGMAERSMCIPWMRQVAERRADKIIDESPNGIIIVDSQLRIVEFNRALASLFACTPALIGRPLSSLMDPTDFEQVLTGRQDRITNRPVSYPAYHVTGRLNVYRLEGEDRVVGILSNAVKGSRELTQLDRIREETLASAEQVIRKQMLMAQEIASILGETTSETRVLLRRLTRLMSEDLSEEAAPEKVP